MFTPLERTLTTLSHQEPDRVPLFLFTGLLGARQLGVSIEQYYASADLVIEANTRMVDTYHSDCLATFLYASLEVEAWGGTTVFIENGPPNCGAPIVTKPSEISKLKAPSLDAAAGLQRVLAVTASLKQRFGDEYPILGTVISPFSLPVMQMGFAAYLNLLFEEPERFQELMAVNIEFCVAWANAQLQAGATAIGYVDPVSSPTLISPEMFRQTGLLIMQKTLPRINGSVAIHLASGRCLPILDELIATGALALGVSGLEDLALLKSRSNKRVGLMGNLNGITMRNWTPAQAELEVKRAIAKAGAGGGFVLADHHGEIPWQVPDEVLFALRAAVDRWGRYPLDWVDDWVDDEQDASFVSSQQSHISEQECA